MAPSKRAASAVPKGRPKVSKVDPAIERVRCVIDIISDFAPHLPDAAADMLRSMVPYSFSLPAAERHAYQAAVVAAVQDVADEAARTCANSVAAAEAEIASHVAEMNASEDVLSKAREEEETKSAAKNSAADALKSAMEAEAAAVAEAKLARSARDDAEQATAAAVGDKADFEEIYTATWKSLAAGTFEGKEWRKRNKEIAVVLKLLEEAEAPESLREAINMALKEKPEARGAFTTKAVEFGDTQLQSRLAALGARVAERQSAHAERANRAEEVDAKVDAATKETAAANDASVAAAGEWALAEKAVRNISRSIKGFGKRSRELEDALVEKQASRQRLRELTAGFEALRDAVAEAVSLKEASEEKKDPGFQAAETVEMPVIEEA